MVYDLMFKCYRCDKCDRPIEKGEATGSFEYNHKWILCTECAKEIRVLIKGW